jgi:hypothetical protein
LHAGLAADTAIAIQVDDAVLAGVERFDGANLDARRIVTVIASHHAEVAAGSGILALFDVLYPRAKAADGHLVLGLTSDRTRMASDALALVQHEAITHRRNSITPLEEFVDDGRWVVQ